MIYKTLKHKKLNCSWFLKQLSLSWANKLKEGYTPEGEYIDMLYSQAINLQLQQDYGFVMPLIMFYEWVKDGFLIDYDGSGVFLDWEGDRQGYVRCSEKWLKEQIEKYPFVIWFNK